MRFGGRGMMRRDEPEYKMKPLQALRRLSCYIWPYKWIALIAFATMIGNSFLHALPPQVLRGLNALDDPEVRAGLTINYFVTLGAIFMGLHLLSAGMSYANRYASSWLGQNVIRNIRLQLFGHMQQLPLSYYDDNQTGELMSRVLGDVDQLEWGVLDSFMQLINALFTLSVQVGFMFYLSPRLTIIGLAAVPPIVFVAVRFNVDAHKLFKGLREQMADISSVVQENISGVRVVKAFCREDYEHDRFNSECDSYCKRAVTTARMMGLIGSLSTIFASAATAVFIGYGGWMIMQGSIGTGDFMALLGYMTMLYHPIHSLVHANYHMQRSGVAATRVFEVIDTKPEIIDTPDALPMPQIEGGVSFHDVHFNYKDGQPVLEGINLDVKPGEMIAFVGRSGSGKTTLINLITRMYDVIDGSVCIDGHDVRNVCYKDLRRRIAMVMQDVFLFNGTVKENIAYGKLDATDEEILIAAQAAHVDEFARDLPKGYDTEIGERGVKLSGGQRQRIAIARAFLADASILLLDEPTSNVDTHSERLIQEAIERLTHKRTTFVVAHRLSTILNADKIVLISDGRIDAIGTHSELMATSPLYEQLYRVQLNDPQMDGDAVL